jgi:hypothetical protein
MTMDPSKARESEPDNRRHLWKWVENYTGIQIAWKPICQRHQPPFDAFAHQFLKRPSLSLWLGPRGGGKSFLSALETHLSSRWKPGSGTRILGGSLAQSRQIYDALRTIVLDSEGPLGSDEDTIEKLLAGRAVYRNGSEVAILPCSVRSVRGPHVPTLKLDEVDEIDVTLREDALGMCMAKGGLSASILMTSTWHRVGGPLEGLVQRAKAGEFPLHEFCLFEVLEHCSEERSGPWVGGEAGYEKCPACPLKKWCHAERDRNGDIPLAKLSHGHYAIDAAIQKVCVASARVFEADYLCKGPKADGVWFTRFDVLFNVSEDAEYDPALPVLVAVDSGVTTGAVFLQSREIRGLKHANVFADYLQVEETAQQNAVTILRVAAERCSGRIDRAVTDPAGSARNPVGNKVIDEYGLGGLRLEHWPMRRVVDGLALVEGFVQSADGTVRLKIHPRCKGLIAAFQGYTRAKRSGQWQDYPEDPQHPHEDLMDALRGGLVALNNEQKVLLPSELRARGRERN